MILSFDIGGTFIKYSIIEDNQIIYKNKVNTPNGSIIKNKLLDIYNELKCIYKIKSIAIASAGQINSELGSVIYAGPTILDYTGQKLKHYLTSKTSLQVCVLNDVNAALQAIEVDNALLIQFGTGIGGALKINGEIYNGKNYSALEIGNMIVNNKRFEDICSAKALCEEFELYYKRPIDGFEINNLYKNEDKLCLTILNNFYKNIASALCSLIVTLDPSNIYFGGGISESDFFDITKIVEELNNFADPVFIKRCSFNKMKYGNDAAMIGVYNHCIREKENNG